MPRMSYVSNDEYRSGKNQDSPENENCDFCADCWPAAVADPREAMNVPAEVGDEWIETDGCDHPDYGDADYTCEACSRVLTSDDN